MSWLKQRTNLASISSTNLMRLLVVVPHEQEQNQILQLIDASDRKYGGLVGQGEHAIVLPQECRIALISSAVTGKSMVPIDHGL